MNAKGFTLIESLVVIAVVSILGTLTYNQVSNTRESARVSKLDSDVQSLNSAVNLYQTFGGSIPDGTTAEAVIAKLKTRRSSDSANTSAGITGSFIDVRVSPVWQSGGESSSSQARATWNGQRFVVTTAAGNAGIKEFILDNSLATGTPTTEARTDALKVADRSSEAPTWVWNYEDAVALNSPAAPADFGGLPGSYPISVANAQNFDSGYWTVGDSGEVDVSYVFREAGYNSRLALFSLEGMGPDVYDLDTAEGQKAFLLEAMQRVMDGDSGSGTLGKTIIDASQNSVGYGNTYSFRAGDTLAAIVIPNASFQTAYDALSNGNPTSQQTPLTSLSREGGEQAPFYANQYANLGEGTSAYAIEDIATVGSSDNDYQDLVFVADGLEQAQSSSTYTIDDPIAFYREDPYWENGPGGSPGLHEKFIGAGIIPADTPLWEDS